MINEIIARSNTRDFYQNCNFNLESYSYNAKEQIFEIILSINQISYDDYIEYEEWKISCINTEKVRGFDSGLMMPYVKMKILDKHPLLWTYHEDELYYKIAGTPKDINKLSFDLINLFKTQTGNWVGFHEVFWDFGSQFKKEGSTGISIPLPLSEGIEAICTKQDLSFKTTKYSGEDKGSDNKPNTKLLIFGNEDVSPHLNNLGQSYIIAEEFKAERIK